MSGTTNQSQYQYQHTKIGRATVRVTRGPSVTVAVFEFIDADGSVTEFVGEAKRHPRDREDRNIGEAYAVGRALQAAANDMLIRADQMVVKNSVPANVRSLLDLVDAFKGLFQDPLSTGGQES